MCVVRKRRKGVCVRACCWMERILEEREEMDCSALSNSLSNDFSNSPLHTHTHIQVEGER